MMQLYYSLLSCASKLSEFRLGVRRAHLTEIQWEPKGHQFLGAVMPNREAEKHQHSDVKVLERREGICLITIHFEHTTLDGCEFRRRRF
jgi:hypothetical protein